MPHRTLSKTAATAKKLISTTFSYVEAYGLPYLPLMVRDMFLASRKSDSRTCTGAQFNLLENGEGLSTEAKVSIAKAILKHSGLRAFFIAARRETTLGMNLGGRSFLHDYDQSADADGSTLELILTAPLVVAQWINMQYYASTVDKRVFGSGSKLLHSAIGSFGVLEGVNCNLRVGLPWQSVHDGQNFVHEPLKRQVFVEATPASIDRVLTKSTSLFVPPLFLPIPATASPKICTEIRRREDCE